jgi:hypothetical protein
VTKNVIAQTAVLINMARTLVWWRTVLHIISRGSHLRKDGEAVVTVPVLDRNMDIENAIHVIMDSAISLGTSME